MIPLSLHYERNSGEKTRFSLQILVLFLFLTAITANVAANPISPVQWTEVTRQIQYSPVSAGPVSSMEWTQATEHAQFADRGAHSTVVFDDSIWVIGGAVHPSPYFSEVWRSDNGITWTQVTRQAAFGQRAGHGSVVFDNKLWVIGGREGGSLKFRNDVWYSEDGITWNLATANASFSPRVEFGTTVYDNRIWIIGGNANDGTPVNDVWYSVDGITWTQATGHAGFSPRMQPSACVYNDKIWLTGGFDWKGVFNDVWTSEDGVKWTQVSPHAPFVPRRYQHMESAGGKIWVIGGFDGKKTLNDVWYTTDGVTWTKAVGQRMFPPRYSFTTAFFNNRLWVIAGTTGNDVWYSDELPFTATMSSQAPPVNQPTQLIVTRTIFPSSIKEGTDTVITITLQNKDKFPVHDIDILDTPPDDFPVVDGITRFTIPSIGPDDTRILTYTVRAKNAGTFRLNKTAVMYADEEGNYHLAYSDYTNVKVFPSLFEPVPEDPVDGFFQKIYTWINGFDLFR
jgi:hypothetical protein